MFMRQNFFKNGNKDLAHEPSSTLVIQQVNVGFVAAGFIK